MYPPRMLIREKERDEGMQGQHWKRLEYGALLKQQMCEQERLRKEELCLKYKDRRCYEELEGHRKNLLLKHSEAAISKHKFVLVAVMVVVLVVAVVVAVVVVVVVAVVVVVVVAVVAVVLGIL